MENFPFRAPLVVGYKGEIGSFILQGLLRHMPKALDIYCVDKNESHDEVTDRIKRSDVIFLCVPIKETVHWLIQYRALLKGKVVYEQTSLKSTVYKNINKIFAYKANFELKSMHILFRPSATPNKSDRKVAIIDPTKFGPEETAAIAAITESDIQWIVNHAMHDLIMARQQALMHRVLLTLDRTVGNNPKTYISLKVRELCDRILSGDAGLYESIQNNHYLPKALNEFKRNLRKFNIKNEFKT